MFILVVTALAFANMMNLPRDSQLEFEATLSHPNVTPTDEITFSDIRFLEYLHSGAGKMGFKAKLRGRKRLYAVKITADRHLSDTETQMLNILNAPPTIRNIPKVELYIPSMSNPFNNRTYLEKDLGVSHQRSKWLSRIDTISVIVST
jgi:hypothetical protein